MATIALEGMQFYAYHGYYEEERIIGSNYLVDVYITAATKKAATTDDLKDTINYETVYLIVEAEMRHPSQLLEQVNQRIITGLKHQFSKMQAVQVGIRKLKPPLEGLGESSSVGDEENFVSSCGRCKKPFICYGDEECWCKNASVIHPATLDNLRHQFGGKCLCQDCLAYYAG